MKIKNVMIFGDSYSTFNGYIPEGYRTYYSEEWRNETDVRKVEETWWKQFLSATGASLTQNNSWSGSTIGYTGYNNEDRFTTVNRITNRRLARLRLYFIWVT